MTLNELKFAKLKEAMQRHVLAEDPYGMRRKWLAEMIEEVAQATADAVRPERWVNPEWETGYIDGNNETVDDFDRRREAFLGDNKQV